MPSRPESRTQSDLMRRALREAVLNDCRDGHLLPGDALPPVRELATRHGLSTTTAQRVLKSLADEGILQLRQGAGAFVNQLPEHGEVAFAAVFGEEVDKIGYQRLIRDGFEAAMSRRFAASFTLNPESPRTPELLRSVTQGDVELGGVFYFPSSCREHMRLAEAILDTAAAPRLVSYCEESLDDSSRGEDRPSRSGDIIRFDDLDGAAQAVRHLWHRGHRNQAYLALHHPGGTWPLLSWSRRRVVGFGAALGEMGGKAHVFHPPHPPDDVEGDTQIKCGKHAAESLLPLLRSGEVTAVVCDNHFVYAGLLEAMDEARIPPALHPEVVAFDDEYDEHLIPVLRQPWDELGRMAAEALWDRTFGPPERRLAARREILVPMRLVIRLPGRRLQPLAAG